MLFLLSGRCAKCANRVRLVPEGRGETLLTMYGFRAEELLQREMFRCLQTSLLQTE